MIRTVRTAAVLLAGAAAISMGGCATKGFVRDQVGVVDTKLQGTQAQVAQNQSQLQAHDQRIAELDQTSRDALQRANDAGKLAEGKFTYTTVLSDDSVVFAPNRAVLTEEAKTRLGELADRLKSDNRNVYLEIQGYTDHSELRRNRRLGDQRAEAVRRYLSQQGVALNRMATISFGDQRPATPNITGESATSASATPAPLTRTGSNRRVVVMVMQ